MKRFVRRSTLVRGVAMLAALPAVFSPGKGGNLRITVVLVMILAASVLFVNCGDPPPRLTEISNQGSSEVEPYDIDTMFECNIMYTVTFDDHDESSGDSTFYYWLALMDINDDEFVTGGESVSGNPPISGGTITLTLPPKSPVRRGEKYNLCLVKTDDYASVGDPTQAHVTVGTFDPITFHGFPEGCCPYVVTVYANEEAVDTSGYTGGCVFISEEPEMPQLTAKITEGEVSGDVDWRLIISYTRSGRQDFDTLKSWGWADQSWQISQDLGDKFRGGQAKLTCTPEEIGYEYEMEFGIRAYNQDEYTIASYIDDLPGSMWYWKYVAKHEGGEQDYRRYLQFNEEWDLVEACDSTGVRYTPNAAGDGGFGLYQLTWFDSPARHPNAQELWDWKENVASGTEWLAHHQTDAKGYMKVERVEGQHYGSGDSMFVPVVTVCGVVFADQTDITIEDAVALKRYNGVGRWPTHFIYIGDSRDYIEFHVDSRAWRLHEWAYYYRDGHLDSNNYVHSVCNQVE